MWRVLHTEWTCQGRKQSPIDIRTDQVINDTVVKNIVIKVEPEGRPLSGILRNNGHAPTFSLTEGATVKLSGATLVNEYVLRQFHFHFGCDDSKGSEHKIDGQAYPLEVRDKGGLPQRECVINLIDLCIFFKSSFLNWEMFN